MLGVFVRLENMMLGSFIDRLLMRRHPNKTVAQVAAEVNARHESAGRVVAARYTRGNVNIQEGRYLTKQDIEHRKLSS